jgi:hypothetical protein
MYRQSLRWLLLIAIVLLVPSWTSSARASGPALQYVPPDAMAVVGVDFDKLRPTAVQKTLEAALKKDKEATKKIGELKAETGFDVFKDVHGLTVVLPEEVLKDDDQFVLVLDAKIDEARMVKFMEKKNGPLPKQQGANGAYYEIDGGKAGLAFRGKYMIVGGMATFQKVLGGTTDPATVFPTLRTKVEKEMLWVVGSVTAAAQKKLSQADANAGKLQSFAAGISVPDGAKLRATAQFSDAAAADTLAKLMNKGLGELANDNGLKQMGLTDLVSKVTVSAQGTELSLLADLTKAQVERVTKAIQAVLK